MMPSTFELWRLISSSWQILGLGIFGIASLVIYELCIFSKQNSEMDTLCCLVMEVIVLLILVALEDNTAETV